MSEKIIHPIMAANNMKLKCSFFFFGQCQLLGGDAFPITVKTFKR